MNAIEPDVVAEGKRLLGRAEDEGVILRLLGGVAICLRAENGIPAVFERLYADLDFVTSRGAAGGVARLFRSEGYEPHVAFNALHGNERLLFFDETHGRQVDVFVGTFRMSHAIPLEGRIEFEPGTLPLADLLLTKLQIAELNEKDVRDALALLHGHPVDEEDGASVNAARIAELCAADWGLWRTFTGNLATCREHLARYDLPAEEGYKVAARIDAVAERIEREPKSRAWRLRARVGERKRWYETPEEVAGGP
ncbi:MAG: hypothetical protein ACRDNC_13220 [Gaiellaceae bacterium]